MKCRLGSTLEHLFELFAMIDLCMHCIIARRYNSLLEQRCYKLSILSLDCTTPSINNTGSKKNHAALEFSNTGARKVGTSFPWTNRSSLLTLGQPNHISHHERTSLPVTTISQHRQPHSPTPAPARGSVGKGRGHTPFPRKRKQKKRKRSTIPRTQGEEDRRKTSKRKGDEAYKNERSRSSTLATYQTHAKRAGARDDRTPGRWKSGLTEWIRQTTFVTKRVWAAESV